MNPLNLLLAVTALIGLTTAPTPTGGTAQPTVGPITVSVTSTIKMGTAQVALPVNQMVTLHVLRGSANGDTTEPVTQTVPIPADGVLKLSDFSTLPGDVCVITFDYDGITQGSAPVAITGTEKTIDLSVTLYAGAHDPGAVKISRDQQILNFVPGGLIEVLETVNWVTTGDHYYLSDKTLADGTPISVSLPLPVGAHAIAFSTQPVRRFAIGGDANAPIIQDTAPVIPGRSHQVVFSYQVPYTAGAFIDRDYPYTTDQVSVLIPNDTSVVLNGSSGSTFTHSQNTTLDAQRPYTEYALSSSLNNAGRLIYTLTGAPKVVLDPANPSPSPTESGTTIAGVLAGLGAAIILLVIIVGAIRFFDRKRVTVSNKGQSGRQ